MIEPLSEIPRQFVAGTTVSWTFAKGSSDYVGWGLEYHFVKAGHRFSPSAFSTLLVGGFQIIISATHSEAIPPGVYKYQARVFKDSDVVLVDEGTIEVLPGFASEGNAGGLDARSDAEAMLDALNATLRGKASQDQLSMSISGRSLSRMSPGELREWRNELRGEVQRERGTKPKIRTRF